MTLKGGNNNTRLGLLIHFNIITVVLFYDTAWKWIWVRGCSFFFNFESRPATFLGDILRPLFLHSAKSEKWRRKLWWNIQKKLPKTKKKLDQITASGWQCRQNAPDFRRPSCKKEKKKKKNVWSTGWCRLTGTGPRLCHVTARTILWPFFS